MAFIFSVIGVVLIIEGIPYLTFPKKVRVWALLLQDIPDNTLRLMGLFAMGAGFLILYMVKFF